MSGISQLARTAFWMMTYATATLAGRQVHVSTTNDNNYYFLNDLGISPESRALIFDVTSRQDAIITLTQLMDRSGSNCDIILGASGNSGIAVRESCSGCFSTLEASGEFLDEFNATAFWLDWRSDTTLKAGEGTVIGQAVLFTHTWTERFKVNYVAVSSYYGQVGEWNFIIETAPVFTSPSPDGSTIVFVGENEPSGNTILTLAASDDEGDTVTFAVIGQHNEVFECHNSDVILKRSLDYEMERFFLISIIATDGPQNTSVTFSLHVTDVIDEPPKLILGPVTSLQEELAIGTIIPGLFEVTDADKGDNHTFVLTGSQSYLFAINESTGLVTVASRVERDGPGGLTLIDELTVVVTDMAGLSTSLNLILEVKDMNDNPPVFERNFYTVDVTNQSKKGELLLTFNVTDVDLGSNSNFSLALMSGGGSTDSEFWVEGMDLYANSSKLFGCNDSAVSEHTLWVKARDNGVPSVSSIAIVKVQVIHSNEHAPVWVNPLPNTSGFFPEINIAEDTEVGSQLLQFSAYDGDVGYFAQVQYVLESVMSDNGTSSFSLFYLETKTGNLKTNGVLDRDPATGGAEFYTLTLSARDAGSKSCQATLRIRLQDVNDNMPSFHRATDFLESSCDVRSGTNITRLRAQDNDFGAVVSYSLLDVRSDYFVIDSITGELQLTANSSFIAAESATQVLSVTAKDSGIPEMTSTAIIVLTFKGCLTDKLKSEKAHEEDKSFYLTFSLVVTCCVLGTLLVVSLIANVFQRLGPRKIGSDPLMSLGQAPRGFISTEVPKWISKRNKSSELPSSNEGSNTGSQATVLTDCSSVHSLSLV